MSCEKIKVVTVPGEGIGVFYKNKCFGFVSDKFDVRKIKLDLLSDEKPEEIIKKYIRTLDI